MRATPVWFIRTSSQLGELAEPIATCILCHLGVYCAAVGAIVLVRQPVYAAFVAMAALLSFVCLSDAMRGWTHYYTLGWMIALSVAASLIAVAAAWIAVRKDWGWKG